MLVLSRKLGQKVIIGEDIVVTVAAVYRGRVQLTFDAPRDVAIVRAELADRRHGHRTDELPQLKEADARPEFVTAGCCTEGRAAEVFARPEGGSS
jgi:carbon storage regulator